MVTDKGMINAEVISVMPNRIKINVYDLRSFNLAEEKLSVGSYLRISDSFHCAIIAVVDSYSIDYKNDERYFVLEAAPIGFIDSDNRFSRGGNNIAIPPTKAEPAKKEELNAIYSQIIPDKRFSFSV